MANQAAKLQSIVLLLQSIANSINLRTVKLPKRSIGDAVGSKPKHS
jgi:hypothetical protein